MRPLPPGFVALADYRRWLHDDRDLVCFTKKELLFIKEAEQGITSDLLHRTAIAFNVRKQFRGSGAAVLQPAVQSVLDAEARLHEQFDPGIVTRLANDLSRKMPVKKSKSGSPIKPLSAASKFLWVAKPQGGIIYDRHAKRALIALDRIRWDVEYPTFAKAFLCEFSDRSSQIDEILSDALPDHIGLPWARKRLFDLWLFVNGRCLERIAKKKQEN